MPGMRGQRSIAMSLALILVGLASARPASAGQPSPETADAFEKYIQSKEAADRRTFPDLQEFLKIDGLPEADRNENYALLRRGDILIGSDAVEGSSPRRVPGGLIHDWIGLVFVPSASMRQTLGALQDYGHDADYYRPQVLNAKLLSHSGDDFHIFLRLKQTHGITVVFDTEYDVHYNYLDARHVYSRSYSTRIAEITNPGEKTEHEAAAADDRGFLWRLYSYWRFYEADGGVYIQCNAISLTRDVPAGLGWIVRPFIEKIPRESLSITLDATRKALAGKYSAATQITTREKR